jgi:hypothetical protein
LLGYCQLPNIACYPVVCAGHAAVSNGVKRAKHSHHWKPAAIVLDIEGTVAPISFVADVMFPHARDNVRAYLESHYNSAETRADIDAIRKQVCSTRFFLCLVPLLSSDVNPRGTSHSQLFAS